MTNQTKKAKQAVKETGNIIQTLAELGDLEFITSGIAEVDAITGGLPKSRISEIYGVQGVGKTHLMYKCLSAISNEGKTLYIDVENAMNPARLKSMGVNEKNILIANMSMLEDVAEYTIANIDKYDVMIVDSVAALIPKAELEGATGDQFIGLKARLMGQWLRRLVPVLGKSKCAMLFINQLRESPSVYVPKFTPGGRALPYAASLRLELSYNRSSRISDKAGGYTGHRVLVEVTKSKVCKPYQKTEFDLEY